MYKKIDDFVICDFVHIDASSLILEQVKNTKSQYVFITFDEEFSVLAEKVTYLRDSLYSLQKSLIFGFLLEQLKFMQRKYIDFVSYSMFTLNYCVDFPIPFSLILSSEILYIRPLSFYKKNQRVYKRLVPESRDDFTFAEYQIKRYKYVICNGVKSQRLQFTVQRFLNKKYSLSPQNLEEVTRVINITFEYADVLRGRDDIQFLREIMQPLFEKVLLGISISTNLELTRFSGQNISTVLGLLEQLSIPKECTVWIHRFLINCIYLTLKFPELGSPRRFALLQLNWVESHDNIFTISELFNAHNDYVIVQLISQADINNPLYYYTNNVYFFPSCGDGREFYLQLQFSCLMFNG